MKSFQPFSIDLIMSCGISGEKTRGLALADDQFDRLLVERYEALAAKPCSFMGNHAICEIATRLQHGQSRFGRSTVHHHIARVEQVVDRL
ncbi:hypothetical protein RLEG3_01495 (plasmid) [Rhizobium leguminosarum bv. trifolii WSM1689]|nr:hypothetical protein RLEG3_01495 [Rhizobium leguminosarum bv. trifolii WSM1689]